MDDKPGAMSGESAERGRRRWRFGGALVDETTLELLVDGVDAELERKPLEVLIYLLEHAGEVCTKDELLAAVWPGRILSETVLTKCIGRLREAVGDPGQEIIKTVYGFGYRFIAPLQVELAATRQAAPFAFDPGDHPPARPLWTLIERLADEGETWRVRHEKTHEQRVFKFALDEASLATLKREITLFRILNDSLGERAPIVRLLDWNLEEPPYFTEAEYMGGGSIVAWAKSRGGIAAIPLAERLEVVARIASALAALHSVGVLHKDLKPSNIFVKPVAGQPVDIALGDFGSGEVFDPRHIDRLGITRLGFTTTAAPSSGRNSATPPYAAPETLEGEPFTVKADIYALGVILYQLLAGDFHKAPSPGWERDIEDELLREDIALAAAEQPAARPADADVLARRLRSLEERRARLEAERDAQARAEDTRHLAGTQSRHRRMAVALAALLVALAISIGLDVKARRAEESARTAAAQSDAVTQFLSNEVLAPRSNSADAAKQAVTLELLTRAGDDIDERFAGQPRVAAELHYRIGNSLAQLHEYPAAVQHLRRALQLGESGDESRADAVLGSAAELAEIDYILGQLQDTLPRYEAVLAAAEGHTAADDAALLDLRQQVALGRYRLGDWSRAAQALEDLLNNQGSSGPPSEFIGATELYLGQVLTDLAKPADAEVHLRRAVDVLTRTRGAMHAQVTEARAALGRSLADAGQYDEAATELDKAQELTARAAALEPWSAVQPRYFRALLLLQLDRPQQAEPILRQIIDDAASIPSPLQAHADLRAPVLANDDRSVRELDRTAGVRQALGEAYSREGKFDAALATLQRAVAVSNQADGPRHPATVSTRLSLAECLLAQGRDTEARSVLANPAIDLAALPAVHPIVAQWDRVNGLLALHAGNVEQARKWFGSSLTILQALYGPEHWRVLRARQEFQSTASARAADRGGFSGGMPTPVT
jgi:DNA-binding winged helix-turn-helix (wHTH) protein/tetratricopeptide (TPR) repeat protein